MPPLVKTRSCLPTWIFSTVGCHTTRLRCNHAATASPIDLPHQLWGGLMFFLTYLRRELRRRMKQAVVIALGRALGVGLVITVSAASSGVKKAQNDVLSSLYGVGTDVTVTKTPSPPKN